jgi:hypothetical protein
MQVTPKLSTLAAMLLFTSALQSQDFVNVQMLYYDENDETTTVVSPFVELGLDLGADYTLHASVGMDAITGASETYYDKSYVPASGASPYKHSVANPSAYARGSVIAQKDVGYGLVDYRDYRYSGEVSLTQRLANRDEVTYGFSYNNEYDYHIPELSLGYKHWLDSGKNSSLEASVAYQKAWVLIWCRNNDLCDTNSGASETFYQYNTFAQLSYAQVIDPGTQMQLTLFYNDENGFLSNPYKNIVRDYDTAPRVTSERRPDNRQGYGAKIAFQKAVGAKTTMHGSYRYYHDNWEMDGHTLQSEIYYDYSGKTRLEGTLRYHTQSAASFYSGRKDYFTDQKYASSDIRLGDLESWFVQGGISYRLSRDLVQSLCLSYYEQDNGMHAVSMIIGEKYLF